MSLRRRRPAIAVLALLVTVGAGCREAPPGPDGVDPELREALGLSGLETLHRFTVGGHPSGERVLPGRREVAPGDLVEFVTADAGVHTVAFERDSLTADGAAFLDRTNQVASPPLVERGTRWVLTFEDAPPGRYPFRAVGNTGEARGVVVVRSR